MITDNNFKSNYKNHCYQKCVATAQNVRSLQQRRGLHYSQTLLVLSFSKKRKFSNFNIFENYKNENDKSRDNHLRKSKNKQTFGQGMLHGSGLGYRSDGLCSLLAARLSFLNRENCERDQWPPKFWIQCRTNFKVEWRLMMMMKAANETSHPNASNPFQTDRSWPQSPRRVYKPRQPVIRYFNRYDCILCLAIDEVSSISTFSVLLSSITNFPQSIIRYHRPHLKSVSHSEFRIGKVFVSISFPFHWS